MHIKSNTIFALTRRRVWAFHEKTNTDHSFTQAGETRRERGDGTFAFSFALRLDGIAAGDSQGFEGPVAGGFKWLSEGDRLVSGGRNNHRQWLVIRAGSAKEENH